MSLRLLGKIVVLFLAVFGISNYLLYLKMGQMPLGGWVQTWKAEGMEGLSKKISTEEVTAKIKQVKNGLTTNNFLPSNQTVSVYKWTDAEGVVHYSERPQSKNAQELHINPDVNILSSASGSTENKKHIDINAANSHSPIEKARAAAEQISIRNNAAQHIH